MAYRFWLLTLVGTLTLGCGDDDRRPPVDASIDAAEDTSGDAGPCGGRCEGDFPFCVADTDECVACLGLEGCEDGFVCEAGSCVAPSCEEASDCTLVTAAFCDPEESVCSPCTDTEQCAHLGALVCAEGVCIEPPPNPTCTPCENDTECGSGICIFMRFAGDLLDQAYCALPAPAGVAECEDAPYLSRIRGRASVDGTTVGDFCSIDEAVTTCEAVQDARAGRTCENEDGCGVEGRLDARCVGSLCTQRCRASADCDEGESCWDGETTAEDPAPPPETALYCGAE